MKIEVLGTGCAKCDKLYEQVCQAVSGAGVQAEVIKVDKLDQILACGVMLTPALLIDGQVKAAGKLPKIEQIIVWLSEAAGATK